ncbi:MAG: TonB-dependent receptor [Bacteroidota bacterium]
MKLLSTFLLSLSLTIALQAQTIKGRIIDSQSEMPLIGATVVVDLESGQRGATTDLDGYYLLDQIPPGRHQLLVSYLGYEPSTLSNILVTAGKDVILDIRLEESFTQLNEVVVTADPRGNQNELAAVSIRTFSPEEVNRYAGGRADVSRLAGNMAGVSTADDSRNDIVIRGNSPAGLLWQLEGINIPNPNHFSTLGTTGGPVSALNPNLLASSDFITSAFPAEYGNATSGVFDLRLRNGNRDRYEFMAQLGTFTGIELMAEGPVNDRGGSFVVGFRNSFVGLASSLGLDIGTNATPDYRDLTFKVDFGDSKAGRFSLFGIGGTSNIDFLGTETDDEDIFANPSRNSYADSQFGVFGIRHNLITGEETYLRTVIAASYQGNDFSEFDIDRAGSDSLILTNVEDATIRYSIKSYLNSKLSNRLSIRTGIQADLNQLNTTVDDRVGSPDRDEDGIPDFDRLRDFDDQFNLLQAFAQTRFRITKDLTMNAGVHLQYFDLSEAFGIEPRLGLEYRVSEPLQLTLGYGRHNQTPALPVFFFRDLSTGSPNANQDLGFQSADHLVVGATWQIAPQWQLKTEAYYQWLFNVPVDNFPSSFSILNAGADFVFPERGSLVSDGTGTNYGLELTLERQFADNWYLLFTGSVFESNYTGSDGVERPTAFNNQYVTNILLGREIPVGKDGRNRITINTRLTTSGGRYYSPIDLEASIAANEDVRNETLAFSERYDNYFRWDLKFGIQLNSPNRRFSQSFFIDFQNLTNRENIFQRRFNPATQQENVLLQSGFFPDVQYRIQF